LSDASIERVAISGNGACFSTGGDVDEFGSVADGISAHTIRSLRLPANLLVQCAARLTFNVHSACIGAGVEIPAFGHRVNATRNAFFQLPELQFGLIPGAGGCVSLPRRIGRQRTAYMALSMKKINAATALDWGLIDAIVD
ncbi:MAG TPA: enoyl-CoA hydratase/isomerase family protein, partial [Spongiibacteraceae bacterium]|nr:enoyl-CoA hydratase/isomerase family protein [Spongiibacteraceae bacterium]